MRVAFSNKHSESISHYLRPHLHTCAGSRYRRSFTINLNPQLPGYINSATPECPDAFHYTSGRWLYNESKRLEERYMSFNIPELVKAAAVSIEQDEADVQRIRKVAEGGFNRVFEVTMNDGFQVVEGTIKQEEADGQTDILRNVIGINTDGWVSHERYEDAARQVAEMKKQAISYAEDDFEREMTIRHSPFHDHDEKE